MLIVGVLFAVWLVAGWVYDSQLEHALAEADRLDPGWRLDELEAKRPTIPDNENSALTVMTAYKLLPKPWPTPSQTGQGVDDRLSELPSPLLPPDLLSNFRSRISMPLSSALHIS